MKPFCSPRWAVPGCVLLLMVTGCAKPPAPKGGRVAVTVATAESRVVPLVLSAPGTIEAIQSATVHAQVGGLVTRIGFIEGDEVRAGQLLFQLDRRPFQNALAQAEGAFRRDRANARAAQANTDRGRALLAQNLLAPQEQEQRVAAAEALLATVAADSATVLRARFDLDNASIRAPISGRTGEAMVHVGDLIKANATDQPLVELNQLAPIRVRFTLGSDAIDALRGHAGAHGVVHVRSIADDSLLADGTLSFVDHSVDPATGTVLLKAECRNANGLLWPGESVRVKLELAADKAACAVPSAAVTIGQQGAFTFVLLPDSTVKMQPVKVARDAGDWCVIAAGLTPGDIVVTDGQFRLAPGGKVVVRAPAPSLGVGAPGKPPASVPGR